MGEKYLVEAEKLTDIADAIRLKTDSTTPMTLDDMPLQISLIEGWGGFNIGDIEIKYKKVTVDNGSSIRSTKNLADLFANSCGCEVNDICMFVLDKPISSAVHNNVYLSAQLAFKGLNHIGSCVRFRNGAFSNAVWNDSGYDAYCDDGDTYQVLYYS